MIGLALLFIAFAIGDLVAGGLAGEVKTPSRLAWGAVSGLVAVVVVVVATRPALGSPVAVVGLAVLGSLAWSFCKLGLSRAEARQDGSSPRRWALGGLAAMGGSVLGFLTLAATFHADLPGLTAWLHALPFGALKGLTGAEALLLAAILLFLTAPANSVVRVLLTAASTRWQESEKQLRGGRYIGVIERWMIFGLALAGEPTAAALVVSAKGLLRFPELSRKNESLDIDEITEYFLLGSLASWALALALVLLVM